MDETREVLDRHRGCTDDGEGKEPLHVRVFSEVQRDPLVCQNCFAVTHDEDEVPEDYLDRQSAIAPSRVARRHQTQGAHGLPGETVSEWKPSAICECGVVSNFAKNRPATKADLTAYAENLSATLGDFAERADEGERGLGPDDFAHSEKALVYATRKFKSKPDLQYRDDLLLRRALRIAMRHA